jgi:hypothetical protein
VGNNYLLIDESGDMCVVEASPFKVRERKPDQNFVVATNHFIHPEMVDVENMKERIPDSLMRYKRIKEVISTKGGKVDFKLAKKILSDHKGSVCSHIKAIKLGTLWSLIVLPKDREVFIASGHPCKAEYCKDERLKRTARKLFK